MLYRPGNSFFHRADPRVKLFIILGILVLALTTTRLDVLLALILLVTVSLGVGARLTPASYWKALVVIVPLIILLTLLQSLVQSGDAAFTIGAVSFSQRGILLGLALGARLLAMGICFYGFSVTTGPADIALALNRLGVPFKFSYLTSFAFRFLPLMQDEARALLTAMAVRGSSEGSSKTPIRRGRAIVRMLFPMLVGSLKRSGDIALSMELRGYGLPGRRTFHRSLRFRAADGVLLAGMLVVIGAVIAGQVLVPNPLSAL